MSHIQDRLRSISTALRQFDTKEAKLNEDASSVDGGESMAESIASAMTHESQEEQLPSQPLPQSIQPPVEKEKKKSSWLIWIVLVVIVLLVIFGLILYFHNKKRKRLQVEDRKKRTQHVSRPKNEKDPFDQIDSIGTKVAKPPIIIEPPQKDEADSGGGDESDIIPI